MRTGFHFDGSDDLFVIDLREAPVLLALMVIAIVAEVLLARKKDWRLGLALPGVLLAWTAVQFAARVIQFHPPVNLLFLALLLENIPTILLLAIYSLCRLRRQARTAQQLKKTRIEDL